MPKSLFHCLFFEFLLIDFIEKKRLFSIESPLISVHDSPDFIEDMPRGIIYIYICVYFCYWSEDLGIPWLWALWDLLNSAGPPDPPKRHACACGGSERTRTTPTASRVKPRCHGIDWWWTNHPLNHESSNKAEWLLISPISMYASWMGLIHQQSTWTVTHSVARTGTRLRPMRSLELRRWARKEPYEFQTREEGD